MRIGGLDQYGGAYNSYRVNEITKVNIDTVKKQVVEEKAPETQLERVSSSQDSSIQERNDKPVRQGNLENISLDLRTGIEFDFVGKDSSIQSLDVQKAVSDMKKDAVLQEYQYFVGDVQKQLEEIRNQDGIVRQK